MRPPRRGRGGGLTLKNQGFLEEKAAGEAKYCGLRQSPVLPLVLWGFYSKFNNLLLRGSPDRPYWVIQQKNTANNGLVRTPAGRLLATYEAGSPYEIELVREGGATRLATAGVWRPAPGAGGAAYDYLLNNFTAHSKTCPSSAENIFLSYDLIGKRFSVGVMGAGDALRSLETFTYPGTGEASMMHDFAITETKIVILAHPLLFNLEQSMRGGLPFTYDLSAPSYFGVIDRAPGKGGEIQWIQAENCYCYHTVTAHDDPTDGAVVHLYAQRLDATGALGMATFRRDGEYDDAFEVREVARLHKWRLRTGEGAGVLESRNVCERFSDFPEINPEYEGRPTRFAYSLQMSDRYDADGCVPLFETLLKHDLLAGSHETFTREGKVFDDLTFVPDAARPGVEDGGWLLFFSHALTGDRSWLEILDAADIAAGPVCSVELPNVPIGFHATWVDAALVADADAAPVRAGL